VPGEGGHVAAHREDVPRRIAEVKRAAERQARVAERRRGQVRVGVHVEVVPQPVRHADEAHRHRDGRPAEHHDGAAHRRVDARVARAHRTYEVRGAAAERSQRAEDAGRDEERGPPEHGGRR
jgi:hypothetical protein